jgi:ribonucleoside-diphosphate reductase alpha chain
VTNKKTMTAKQIMSKIKPNLAEQSMAVAQKRYMKTDEEGNPVETPEEMFYRVASFMASAEKTFDANADVETLSEQFYQMMAKLEFVPGGRAFFEAGNDHTGQMASCFVLPIEDTMDGIFQTLKDAAVTQQNNGGTGFNFSKIRAKGATVNGVPGVAAGPIHYIQSFDQAFSKVLQGGKRHGGNMGVLNINHPDIEDFIRLKDSGSSIKNFNISVGVTNAFMEAVRDDSQWDLIHPHTKEVAKTVQARDIFDMIVNRAWECADPGMLFIDHVADGNNNPHLYDMVATNPCGEQPLGPYESCNLGSVVLANHVTPAGEVDWNKLQRTSKLAARFMDNMIELNKYPIPAIDYMVRQTRKVGVGVMGFAQMLYKIGIPYNSEEAVNLIEKIMKTIHTSIQEASVELAEERGVYPAWQGSRWQEQGIKIRNSHLTSIAPTGTISMLANTSSGIEPYFNLVTIRKSFFNQSGDNSANSATTLRVVADDFEAIAKERGFYSDELMDKISEEGSIQGFSEIPEDIKKTFVTSRDVALEWHVRIQAAAQKWTDAAVSKTVNLPSDATVEDVRKTYIMAYETKCKGVTVYRDGSKSGQVLALKKKKDEKGETVSVVSTAPVPAPAPQPVLSAGAILSGPDYNPEAFITKNAQTVLEKRALKKNEKGTVIEGPEDLFRRVARFIASPEADYDLPEQRVKEIEEKFYGMLSRLEFIAGQPLRNSETKLTMSACLVLPIEDNIEGIMQTISENVFAHKSTCGTGINYSRIRMKGGEVGEVGSIAAGPVHFMRAVSVAQKTIQTKGGRSQGSMGILNVDHPDIEGFIKAKDKEGEFDNMNISVGVTNKFMDALNNDADYEMIDPGSNKAVRTLKAKEIFDQIANHAWVSGDPGVIFVDRLEADNPTPSLGKLDATNPCGEQPLLPYETCNLGSIVMSRMIKADATTGLPVVDWDKLADIVYYGVRFLDNSIDVNNFPLAKVEQMSKGTRRIGLGVMGFADMLIKLGIPYNTNEAVQLAEQVMDFVNVKGREASEQLGEEKGSFPYFDVSIWPEKGVKARRNSAVTTIAPTGYTSIVANCSSGIEPIYALAFRRENSMGGTNQFESNYLFEKIAKERGFYTEEIMDKIVESGTLEGIEGIPEDVKRVFVTAFDVTPEWHIRIQAAFQKHTDNAVSKTINFPNEATVEEIGQAYKLAYDLGCKGVTIFRDGSRDEQAFLVGKSGSANDKNQAQPVAVEAGAFAEPTTVHEVRQILSRVVEKRPRPDVVAGKTYKKKTGYGEMYVTINNDEEGHPFEVFATIGKTGGVYAAKSESICRLVSLALRSGIKVEDVIAQLQGIRGPMPIWDNGVQVFSLADALAQVLREHYKANQPQLGLDFGGEGKDTSENIKAVKAEIQAKQVEQPKAVQPVVAQVENKPAEAVTVTVTPPTPASANTAQAQPTEKQSTPTQHYADMGMSSQCPDCGYGLEFSEGCLLCRGCGYSKCG